MGFHIESLKYLFEKIPNPKVNDEIFEVCLETIRNKGYEGSAIREMSLLQKYFKINDEFDFESLGNSLKICSRKNEILNIIKGIILFIYLKDIRVTKFLSNLQSIRDQLRSQNFLANKINEGFDELNDIKYNILNDNNEANNIELDNDISQIFKLFNMKPDALKFVMDLKEEDCRNFQEMLDISDNNFLTLSDIQELDTCRKFLNDIDNNAHSNLTDRQLIKIFVEKAKSQKNISLCFKRFFDNYPQLKELKSQKLDIIETNKTKSKKIAADSIFILTIKTESLKNKPIHLEEENNFISFIGQYDPMGNKKNIT